MCSYVIIYRGPVILRAHIKAAWILQRQMYLIIEGVAFYNYLQDSAHRKVPTSEGTKDFKERGVISGLLNNVFLFFYSLRPQKMYTYTQEPINSQISLVVH